MIKKIEIAAILSLIALLAALLISGWIRAREHTQVAGRLDSRAHSALI